MADIFISYKSDRRAAAEHMAEILADHGWSVWWDYELASGKDFGAQIERELRSAKAVLVLWCRLSRDSEWVKEEAGLAKKLGTLVPARIGAVDLPLGFSMAQTIDLTDWDGSPTGGPLRRLTAELARVTGRKARPNADGLARTERAWRRYGAPAMTAFPLTRAVEPERSSLAPPHASPPTRPDSLGKAVQNPWGSPVRQALVLAGGFTLVAAAIVAVLWKLPPYGPADDTGPANVAGDTSLAQATAAAALQEQASYEAARAARTREGYRRFLALYPGSGLAEDARRRMASCTSAFVRSQPGRRVEASMMFDVYGDESVRRCRARLEASCPAGTVEHVSPDNYTFAVTGDPTADPTSNTGPAADNMGCHATCYPTRRVERCA